MRLAGKDCLILALSIDLPGSPLPVLSVGTRWLSPTSALA
jgi:hypothetical protein